MNKKILIIFGTRPEAIKMAPVIIRLKKNNHFITKVCVTAQHREMLDQVLDFFSITPDYDLNLMEKGQSLFKLTSNIFTNIESVFAKFQPDYLLVHGDTTTAMSCAIAAYYAKIKIFHVEAGLRTYNKYSPFPEEINRTIISRVADFHFAPTKQAKNNLLNEDIKEKNIYITGNTVIDTLFDGLKIVSKIKSKVKFTINKKINFKKDIILVTGHRRENFGFGFENICKAIRYIAHNNDVQIIYPVHLNPNVQKVVTEYLSNINNVILIKPLPYEIFIYLMNKSKIILTDSGGIQEEAPSLGKPVLVMRETTERPEAIEIGTVKLVGTDKNKIIKETELLINDSNKYEKISKLANPYGDGKASKRIIEIIENII